MEEFAWRKNKPLAVAGLVLATIATAFWVWEIIRERKLREAGWYNFPFYPETVGFFAEGNQVLFYSACILAKERPLRFALLGIFFHFIYMVKLYAEQKIKEMKEKTEKDDV